MAGIKSWIDDYESLAQQVGELELLPDFVREGAVDEKEADAIYARTLEKPRRSNCATCCRARRTRWAP